MTKVRKSAAIYLKGYSILIMSKEGIFVHDNLYTVLFTNFESFLDSKYVNEVQTVFFFLQNFRSSLFLKQITGRELLFESKVFLSGSRN